MREEPKFQHGQTEVVPFHRFQELFPLQNKTSKMKLCQRKLSYTCHSKGKTSTAYFLATPYFLLSDFVQTKNLNQLNRICVRMCVNKLPLSPRKLNKLPFSPKKSKQTTLLSLNSLLHGLNNIF